MPKLKLTPVLGSHDFAVVEPRPLEVAEKAVLHNGKLIPANLDESPSKVLNVAYPTWLMDVPVYMDNVKRYSLLYKGCYYPYGLIKSINETQFKVQLAILKSDSDPNKFVCFEIQPKEDIIFVRTGNNQAIR